MAKPSLPPYFTDDFVAETIQQALSLETKPKILNQTRLDQDKGFCSIILDLELEVDDKKVLKVVAKFPTFHKLIQSFQELSQPLDSIVARAHNTEVEAYRVLGSFSENSEKSGKSDCLGLRIPHCIGSLPLTSVGSGVLVFGKISGAVTEPNLVEGFSEELTKDTLSTLARLHFVGFQKFTSSEFPEIHIGKLGMYEVTQQLINFLDNAKKFWSENFESEFPVGLESLSKLCDPQLWSRMQEEAKLKTFVHGDLWGNNMLVFEDGERKGRLAAILDWQVLHWGSPGVDIARLFTHSCSHVMISEKFDLLIDYYWEELCRVYRSQTGSVSSPPISKSYLIEEVEKNWPYGSLLCLFQGTIWSSAIQQDLGDEESRKVFYDRILFNLRKSLEFAKRFGLID